MGQIKAWAAFMGTHCIVINSIVQTKEECEVKAEEWYGESIESMMKGKDEDYIDGIMQEITISWEK